MLLIFPVPVGTCKCFVCASGYIGEGVGGVLHWGVGVGEHHSGMLRCFIWYILFDVLKDCSASVLDCLTLRMTAL